MRNYSNCLCCIITFLWFIVRRVTVQLEIRHSNSMQCSMLTVFGRAQLWCCNDNDISMMYVSDDLAIGLPGENLRFIGMKVHLVFWTSVFCRKIIEKAGFQPKQKRKEKKNIVVLANIIIGNTKMVFSWHHATMCCAEYLILVNADFAIMQNFRDTFLRLNYYHRRTSASNSNRVFSIQARNIFFKIIFQWLDNMLFLRTCQMSTSRSILLAEQSSHMEGVEFNNIEIWLLLIGFL